MNFHVNKGACHFIPFFSYRANFWAFAVNDFLDIETICSKSSCQMQLLREINKKTFVDRTSGPN